MKGKVIIIGAGPGDPELLTLKAFRTLQTAGVVLTDRLVSPEILRSYVPLQAEIIYVGKQCGKGSSTAQQTINELMVKYALDGKTVVRLKGGDVSLFSNVLDELEALAARQIPYEIIPGVTAASGAAAYSGIPLTARNHATAVRFLTAYKPDAVTDDYWKELAQSDDTLVFYMSSETLDGVVEKLTQAGIARTKELAVIEQATTPYQKVYTSSLYDYETTLKNKTFFSPALVIIGKAVGLHRQFAWRKEEAIHAEYFKTLHERTATTAEPLGLTA